MVIIYEQHFTPNNVTHAAFGEALVKAVDMGVKAIAYDCEVTPEKMVIGNPVPISLEGSGTTTPNSR